MAEAMRSAVATLLKGIDRYNPENLATLEKYVEVQVRENAYDLEANLAVLKLEEGQYFVSIDGFGWYQFNPTCYQSKTTAQILLKALTNLPHTDFVLCKCLIDHTRNELNEFREVEIITGFEDSIRKYICHVVGITYQTIDKSILIELLGGISSENVKTWISKYGWTDSNSGSVLICNQENKIKTKNITEKIDFDSVAGIMASYN
ncbi:Eukaryotic translation initiation factor 3 subunit K [Nymphon striatum]|nr:Eukaryotic translation initiation factor 3 subunit K [Nymphon striatum]KAG1683668.1 Eukaryotic translation initiation factor 3 subunit K [Nymphon striatum]